MYDLTGRRFGRLTVLAQAASAKQRRRWRCGCDCGAETIVTTTHLTGGNTRSCGCLAREMAVERQRLFDEARVLQLGTSSPTWSVWRGVVLRATVAITDSAAVRIDPGWLGLGGFGRFLADMGARPSADHRLGRIDPDGAYTKSNCVWARAGHREGAA